MARCQDALDTLLGASDAATAAIRSGGDLQASRRQLERVSGLLVPLEAAVSELVEAYGAVAGWADQSQQWQQQVVNLRQQLDEALIAMAKGIRTQKTNRARGWRN